VANQPFRPSVTGPLERFRQDIQRRYPGAGGGDSSRDVDEAGSRSTTAEPAVRLQKLPPEIGVLLLVMGVAGLLLPGPVGSPFVIAGGIALWPAGFRKVEGWFQRRAPRLYHVGMDQMERYLADLENRYPGSVRGM
jgi:hypothetical protein